MVIKKFTLAKTQNTILSAAVILAASSSINAVLGFVKNRLLAYYFGVSNELAVFYTADRIPNLIYSILVVGVVSTIFIPTFTSLKKKDEEKAFNTATAMILCICALFAFLGTVMFITAPQIIRALSLGSFNQSEIILGVNLMRLMIASQLLLLGGSLVSSVLQSYKYFIAPALAPIFYNIGMIFGTIVFSKQLGIYGPAIGMLIGSLFHMGIQIPLVRKSGFRFSAYKPLKDEYMKKAFKLVPPRLIQVALANGVQTIDNTLALIVSTSSVVHLKFATQLQYFPVGIFGLSIASAALPTLSTNSEGEHLDKFKQSLYTSLHQMLFLVMPISVILLVLRVPAVRLIYGVRNFPWDATIKTSYALGFYSISIFSQSANYILSRAFFALKNTKTPVVISIITTTLNVLLATLLITVFNYGVWGIALAFSLASFLETSLLLSALSKEIEGININKIIRPFVKISYASLMMGFTLYGGMKLLDISILDTTKTINLLALTLITTAAGVVSYLLFTYLLKVEEIQMFYQIIKRLNLKAVLKNRKYSEIDQTQIN